jgi:hypothetical protein
VCVVTNYRLYRLDGAGKIVGAEWLAADDDEQAVAQARNGGVHSTLELWDRQRLVIRLRPDPAPGDV